MAKDRTFSSLSSKIPFWHFDDDFMVYADGSLGAGFKLDGVDISCSSTDVVNEISNSLENLFSTAQEGLKVQIFYRLTSNVSDVLEQHSKITGGNLDQYEPIEKSRIDYLKEKAGSGSYFSPEIFCFVRGLPHRYRKQRLWDTDREFQQLTEQEYADHKVKFERSLKQIESSLVQAKLAPTRLSSQEWFNILYEYFNFSRSEKIKSPEIRYGQDFDIDSQSLSEQFSLTDVEVYPGYLKIGDYLFRVVTLKTLPEGQSFASMVESFLKLPFYFWLSQTVSIHDQKKEIEKLQLQRRLAHSVASGAGNVSDLESESKLSHIEDLIQELLEGSEKIVSTDFNVVLWAKDIESLEEKTDEVLKAFRNLNQSEAIAETLPGFEAFMKSMPGACTSFRQKKVKSSNAAHLLPVYSSWRGNERPVCLISNREGSLVSIDVFASSLQAWNGIIFGGTGSGKSFSVLQLILMFYGQRPRPKVVWLDNGASSQQAIEVLGGEFIDVTLQSGIRINAFDLEDGVTKPSPTKVKLILAVLESILKDDDKSGLPKREKALLEEAIFDCYKVVQGRVPYLSDLREFLRNHPVDSIRSFSEILYSWTGDTAYGRLLDGPTNIKLTKNLTTIETKNLSSFPELENVMLLLFTDFIRTEAARDIAQPFLFIIDEGWRIFQTSKTGMAFALEAYRVFRKYNAGIWTISQNYKDFLSNEEIAAAILPNTTSTIILKQRGIDWEDFGKTLGLNQNEIEVVKSLSVVKGKFTEAFYMQEENRSILHITPDPLSYWICTSDPKDKAEIRRMSQLYPDLDKLSVLKKIVEESKEKKEAA